MSLEVIVYRETGQRCQRKQVERFTVGTAKCSATVKRAWARMKELGARHHLSIVSQGEEVFSLVPPARGGPVGFYELRVVMPEAVDHPAYPVREPESCRDSLSRKDHPMFPVR